MPIHIIVAGNIFDGFEIFGPFESFEDAEYWADRHTHDWWVTTLKEPYALTQYI